MHTCQPIREVIAAVSDGGPPRGGPRRDSDAARIRTIALLVAAISLSGGVTTRAQTQDKAVGDAKLFKVNEYADNPEKILDRSRQVRFQGIGMVQRERELAEDAEAIAKDIHAMPQAGHGTGINISPCLVLTNRHVAFGSDVYLDPDENYKMKYNIGYSINSAYANTSELTPKVHGDILYSDFVISKDSNCSGSYIGWYKWSDVSTEYLARLKARVLLVSFSGDQATNNMAISFGNVTGVDAVSGNVLYNASASPGSSGGAVFIVTEGGDISLQGLHVGGPHGEEGEHSFPTYSKEHANQFVNIADIMQREDVRRVVGQDLRDHPVANPLLTYLHVGH
jgi:V8-like Glu-specific endopeptidase